MAKKYDQDQARKLLVSEVVKEVTKYEQEQFWITDSIALNMREMIKQFRKNYWGIYDTPIDPITKQKKFWVPLTQLLVDAVRKSVDPDQKDVRYRSLRMRGNKFVHLLRGFTHRWLSRHYFDHTLNQSVFTMAVDGTTVWKTYFYNGKIIRKDVDLLNVYIDPTADSIQDAYRFTERVLMSKDEVMAMDWENTDKFTTEEDLEKNSGAAERKQGEFGDTYVSYGKYSKCLVMAANGVDIEDDGTEIEAHIVISGIDTGNLQFHFAEENKTTDNEGNIIKPYEEGWYIKVPGRWYGKGVAETVLYLQEWINTIVNLRIKKNTVAQLGLMKVRSGSKVTQQMLQNLVAKGVIELANMNDLENLPVNEAGESSYRDEQVARGWAQDITSIFDSSVNDMPASTTATAAVIGDREKKSAFALINESIEHLVKRWMDRHFLPNVPEMVRKDKYVTFFDSFDDVVKVREMVASQLVMDALKSSDTIPSEEVVDREYQNILSQLEQDKDMFFEVLDDVITEGLEAEVFMTNAEVDVAVMVRNLIELRNGVDPESFREMTAEAFDLLGLRVPSSLMNPTPQELPQGQPDVTIPSEQQLVTAATTIGNEQR